jgi:hypothetical protein
MRRTLLRITIGHVEHAKDIVLDVLDYVARYVCLVVKEVHVELTTPGLKSHDAEENTAGKRPVPEHHNTNSHERLGIADEQREISD